MYVDGGAGLGLGINANYSSHVRAQIDAQKKTSEDDALLGLGWNWTLGYVIANHNFTRRYSDDTYTFVDENGSSHRMIQDITNPNEFYLEDYAFWKIEREIANYGYVPIVTGWVMRREDGKVYEYGDLDRDTCYGHCAESLLRQASRYRLCWGDYGGDGSAYDETDCNSSSCAEIDSVFAFQWDLSRIKTPDQGKEIAISYLQKQKGVQYHKDNTYDTLRWCSENKFTHASWPTRITYPNGYYIELHYAPREDIDCSYSTVLLCEINYVRYRLDEQQIYSYQNLEALALKSAEGGLLDSVHIDYQHHEQDGLKEMLLSAITFLDADDNSLPSYKFSYDTDTSVDHNTLAMDSIIYPSGSIVAYEYEFWGEAQENYSALQKTITKSLANKEGMSGWTAPNAIGDIYKTDNIDAFGVNGYVWNGYWQPVKASWTQPAGCTWLDYDVSDKIIAYTIAEENNCRVIARYNMGGEWDSTQLVDYGNFDPDDSSNEPRIACF